jgi:hypothetical protein
VGGIRPEPGYSGSSILFPARLKPLIPSLHFRTPKSLEITYLQATQPASLPPTPLLLSVFRNLRQRLCSQSLRHLPGALRALFARIWVRTKYAKKVARREGSVVLGFRRSEAERGVPIVPEETEG